MPKITKLYCDICGKEIDITEMEISTGIATKKSIEHTIKVNLTVSRRGSVNSVSEPVGDMPDDIICFICYAEIISKRVHNDQNA